MTPHEMASDEMQQLRAKLTKEAIDDHQMAKREGAKSDLFKCGRCGQRDTTYNQVCNQLNSTQLYYDTFAAEQLNSWIAKYSSIT